MTPHLLLPSKSLSLGKMLEREKNRLGKKERTAATTTMAAAKKDTGLKVKISK